MMRSALITGAARRLGAEIARNLAAAGWHVIIHYHASAQSARALADEIRSAGGNADILAADLSACKADAIVAEAAGLAQAAGAVLCALINNAAQFEPDEIGAINSALLNSHLSINLAMPLQLSAAFVGQLGVDAPDPAIVHILDQKIANPNADFASYTAAKMALAGMVAPMAMGYRGKCRVNGVAPGILYPSHDQTEAEFNAVAGLNLCGQPIDPAQVAATVRFLIECPAMTGEILFADNGQHLVRSDRDIMYLTRGAA